MQLAFADSPRGGGDAFAFDVSEGTAYLLHTAGAIGRRETTAGGTTAKAVVGGGDAAVELGGAVA